MRILQIIDSLRSGGKERQLIELLKGLRARPGVEVCLVLLSDRIEYPDFETLGIETHILRRKRRWDFSVFTQLYRIIRDFRPQVIHSWNSMCSVYAAPLARLAGVRFVNGLVRNAPSDIGLGDPAYLRARLTMPLSDVVMGNSLAGLAAYRVPAAKGRCIHNGFDSGRLLGLQSPDVVRERLEISTPHIVGMVAAFAPRKDYDAFFEMARRISGQRSDVTFLAVGDGELLDEYRRTVSGMGHPGIRILGRRTDVEEIVSTFSVGVLASREGEGISNSLMEYMSLGKPVVATDIGGTSELVISGKTGYLVAPGDTDGLTRSVSALLADDTLRQEFGQAGRRRLETEFSLDRMVQAHESLYQSLIR